MTPDYGVGPGAVITMAEADDAVKTAACMADCIAALPGGVRYGGRNEFTATVQFR
jgi:hypothetical protein